MTDRRKSPGSLVGRNAKAPAERLARVVDWYFSNVYGRLEGPGIKPFYCDRTRVGRLAVHSAGLIGGTESALFKLFITLSMYQGVRDVVVMRRQQSLCASDARALVHLPTIREGTQTNPCPALKVGAAFEDECSVMKMGDRVDCNAHPTQPCHVKTATRAFGRMGDMGKLPTSAWRRIWREKCADVLELAKQSSPDPRVRATLLAERLKVVHRVGEKLAAMYVSTLSTPGLAPGLTPWFPAVDGNDLVVIDTNVAQGIDLLSGERHPNNRSRLQWFLPVAQDLDLRVWHTYLPARSPRLVQQALYWFLSRSNRLAHDDTCRRRQTPCVACVPPLCPFVGRSKPTRPSG